MQAEFVKMNAQVLKFVDETFDAIVTRNLTWTLPDVKASYREWWRIKKIDGEEIFLNVDKTRANKI